MVGRAFLFHLFRRSASVFSIRLRYAGLLMLAAICLVAISALGLRQVLAERSPRGMAASAAVSGTRSRVIGEFEGSFDPKTQRLNIGEASSESISSQLLRRLTLNARSDVTATLPAGSF